MWNPTVTVKCFLSTETSYRSYSLRTCCEEVQIRIHNNKYAQWWISINAHSSAVSVKLLSEGIPAYFIQHTAGQMHTTVMVTRSGRRVWNTNPSCFAPRTRARSSADEQQQHCQHFNRFIYQCQNRSQYKN